MSLKTERGRVPPHRAASPRTSETLTHRPAAFSFHKSLLFLVNFFQDDTSPGQDQGPGARPETLEHQGRGLRGDDGHPERRVRHRPVKKSRGRTVEELKGRHPEVSLDSLCGLFGITRQGLWKQKHAASSEEIDNTAIISEVRLIRKDMPRLGARKLQVKLAENGHDIGRDKLFNLLRESGLLVKRKHYRVITTYSRHWMKKWSNLIRDIVPSHPDEVWVSDITYIEIVQGVKRAFMYLSLITDAYTHEVVGYALHDTLDTTGPLKALGMALAKYPVGTLKGLIHHSDRGSQYCCQEYVNKLQQHGILISMTDKGDPYENAIAERVNGILKTEWLYHITLTSQAMARNVVDRVIYLYNNERPHESIGNMTPAAARATSQQLNKRWKNYWRIRQQAAGSIVDDAPNRCVTAVSL